MILALIRTTLAAIAAYFELANKRLVYDLIDTSEKRQSKLKARIEFEREQRTEAGTQAADVIFQELQKEKAKYEKYLNTLP